MVIYVPDYYKILKIDTTANYNEIKKAYTKLSKKYDQENHKNSTKMYKLVNDAYIVLSDNKKRKKYDKIRKKAIRNKKAPEKNTKDIKKVIDITSEVKDKYDLISKLFTVGSKAMKGKGLLTGSNIIIGGAMAGYGVKKGRDYMAKRKKQSEN